MVPLYIKGTFVVLSSNISTIEALSNSFYTTFVYLLSESVLSDFVIVAIQKFNNLVKKILRDF